MVKSRVSRNCVFERGRDGESGGTLKIRKIRFWAERGPALWGSANRDRRGNKRCATTGPRRVNALGYDSSSGSSGLLWKSLGCSRHVSRELSATCLR